MLAILFITNLCSCGSSPKDTVQRFETAINNYDLDGMVECYEPDVQKVYKGILAAVDMLGGSASNIKDILAGMGGLARLIDANAPDVMPKVDISVDSIDYVEDTKALVTLNVFCSYSGDLLDDSSDTSTETTISVYMVEIDGIWYFSAEMP